MYKWLGLLYVCVGGGVGGGGRWTVILGVYLLPAMYFEFYILFEMFLPGS